MGFSSSPDLSALDQYRTSGKPSVRYWSLGLINRVITKTPCNNLYLLYDVAVIQWITSCHKNCNRALTKRNVIDKSTCQQYVPIEIMFILKVIKSRFEGSVMYVNRILHSWQFHIKFINSPKARSINLARYLHSCRLLCIHVDVIQFA